MLVLSSSPTLHQLQSSSSHQPRPLAEMAKKASSSSRKSLKSLFSRSEASLDGTADKDVDKTEGDKKKFKLFKLRTKSRSGSAAEKGALEEQRARRYVHAPARWVQVACTCFRSHFDFKMNFPIFRNSLVNVCEGSLRRVHSDCDVKGVFQQKYKSSVFFVGSTRPRAL